MDLQKEVPHWLEEAKSNSLSDCYAFILIRADSFGLADYVLLIEIVDFWIFSERAKVTIGDITLAMSRSKEIMSYTEQERQWLLTDITNKFSLQENGK